MPPQLMFSCLASFSRTPRPLLTASSAQLLPAQNSIKASHEQGTSFLSKRVRKCALEVRKNSSVEFLLRPMVRTPRKPILRNRHDSPGHSDRAGAANLHLRGANTSAPAEAPRCFKSQGQSRKMPAKNKTEKNKRKKGLRP